MRLRLIRSRAAWILLVVTAALGAIWFVVAITDSLVRWPGSSAGLGWWHSAQTKAAAAAINPLADDMGPARALAESALQREPVNVVAARTLAVVAARDGDQARAERLFHYAESLSRRDLPTQIWMIEERVQKDDIRGALLHYDRALRTSTTAQAQLLPILASAAASLSIRQPLGALIASRPPWWMPFAHHLLESGQSPEAIHDLIRSLRLDPARETERLILVSAIAKLVDLRAYSLAYRLYVQAGAGGSGRALLRNGEFEADSARPPFDWSFVDEPGLAAVRRPRGDRSDQNALYLISEEGRSGEVANQLLILGPGRYRLTARVGDGPADASALPRLSLRCRVERPPLLELVLPAGGSGMRVQADFVVPAGCEVQRLAIIAGFSLDQRAESWIDSIAVQRI